MCLLWIADFLETNSVLFVSMYIVESRFMLACETLWNDMSSVMYGEYSMYLNDEVSRIF